MPKIMVKIHENGAEGWQVKEKFDDLAKKLAENVPFPVTLSDGQEKRILNPAYIVYLIDDPKEPVLVPHEQD